MRRAVAAGAASFDPGGRVRTVKLSFLLAGIGLLAVLLAHTDLAAVWQQVRRIGAGGFAVVLALHVVTFATDVLAWQLALPGCPRGWRWFARLYAVRMAGEAFNNVTPAASIGGEPLKALVLKARYGVRYRDAAVSLVLARTVIMLALVAFLGVGFALLVTLHLDAGPYRLAASLGLVLLTALTVTLFLAQRLRLGTFAGTRLGRTRLGRRATRLLAVAQEVDERLLHFYVASHGRFAATLLLAFANWVLGVVELYLVFNWFGQPLTFAEAWVVEAMVQLVRAGAFFIPAGLGAQEGALVVSARLLTGQPALGIAFAAVRRARELVWIVVGLGLWWWLAGGRGAQGLTPPAGPEEPAS